MTQIQIIVILVLGVTFSNACEVHGSHPPDGSDSLGQLLIVIAMLSTLFLLPVLMLWLQRTHQLQTKLCKLAEEVPIADIAHHRGEPREPCKMLQVCFLDRGVVIIIQIIEADDFIAALEQVFTDVATDKAGTPCDQNASRHVSGPLGTGQHPSLNWTDYRGC